MKKVMFLVFVLLLIMALATPVLAKGPPDKPYDGTPGFSENAPDHAKAYKAEDKCGDAVIGSNTGEPPGTPWGSNTGSDKDEKQKMDSVCNCDQYWNWAGEGSNP